MEEMDESDIVSSLLIKWNLPEFIDEFKEKGIDIEVLKELTISDVDNLIPYEKFGKRIKFRCNLFKWKEENGYFTPLASTKSAAQSSVGSWLENIPFVISPAPDDSTPPTLWSEFTKESLEQTLKQAIKAQLVLKYFQQHQ
nr:uncharacterized protein LOC111422975 isoform X1 [Onthophagus taurus]